MDKEACPICEHYISEWQKACNKTTRVNGKEYHNTCLAVVKISDIKEMHNEEAAKDRPGVLRTP